LTRSTTAAGVPVLDAPCAVCNRVGGIMKATRRGDGWVHLFCALMLPGITFASPERLEGVDVSRVDKRKFRGPRCCHCDGRPGPGGSFGACIPCAVVGCATVFHPMCAVLANATFGWRESRGRVEGYAYCARHDPKGPTAQRQLPRTGSGVAAPAS